MVWKVQNEIAAGRVRQKRLPLSRSEKCSTAARFLGGRYLLSAAERLSTLERVGSFASGLGNGHIIFDLARHGGESRLYVLALLGGGLEEPDAVVVGHLLALLEGDCSLVLQIGLVADQDASDVVLSVLLNLAHPCVHCVEAVSISDVIHHNDAMSTLVVA